MRERQSTNAKIWKDLIECFDPNHIAAVFWAKGRWRDKKDGKKPDPNSG
jgi:hypothetical protein